MLCHIVVRRRFQSIIKLTEQREKNRSHCRRGRREHFGHEVEMCASDDGLADLPGPEALAGHV